MANALHKNHFRQTPGLEQSVQKEGEPEPFFGGRDNSFFQNNTLQAKAAGGTQNSAASAFGQLQRQVQQVNNSPLIQRSPGPAGFTPSVTVKQQRFEQHADEVVELMGQTEFLPGTGLGNYISSLWEGGASDVAVNVQFGSMASGYIFVRQTGTYDPGGCVTVPLNLFMDVDICDYSPPGTANYQAAKHVLAVSHDAFASREDGVVVLTVQISAGMLYCQLGWVPGRTAATLDPVMDAALVQTDEAAFLPLIFGNDYDGTNYTSTGFQNTFLDGALFFHTMGDLQLPNEQKLSAIFILNDDRHQFFANLNVDPAGLEEINMQVERTDEGYISGDSTELALETTWTDGKADGEDGKYEINGQLRASYANKKLDVFGKASYTSARISGEVNIYLATETKAREAFQRHVPAKPVSGTTPGAGGAGSGGTGGSGSGSGGGTAIPAAPDFDPQEKLAITAWGNLNFKLIDPAKAAPAAPGAPPKTALAGLEGKAAFAASPEGYLVLAGRVKFPTNWKLTDPLDYSSTDAKAEDKHLFNKEIQPIAAPAPFGTIGLQLGIAVDAYAHLDPLELYEIEISGVYSNHPEYRSEVDLTPKLYIQGYAGATITITLDGTYKVLGIFTVAEAGGSLTGDTRVAAFIDAQPTVRKIWEGGDKPAQYALEGLIHTGGKATFTLTGSAHIKLLKNTIAKTKDYTIGSWALGEFGAALKMEEYILGAGKKPEFDFSKMGLNARQRQKLAGALAHKRASATTADDKRSGGFTQVEEGKKKEKGKFSETEIPREDHNKDAVNNEFSQDFLMNERLHQLTLKVSGTREHPDAEVEMASKKKPVKKKIEEEQQIIDTVSVFTDNAGEKKLARQRKDLEGIKQEAETVEKNAEETAQQVSPGEEPHVAGLDLLDERISEYGEKYERSELGFDASGQAPVPPGSVSALQTPRSNGAAAELEDLLAQKRMEVGFADFDNFRRSNVAVFRYRVLKAGQNFIPEDAPKYYSSAVNTRSELHSEAVILGELEKIFKSAEFKKEHGYDATIVVDQVLSERSPCSECQNLLGKQPSKAIKTSNYHNYYLVHYSGDWIARNRNLMVKYGLQPPPLADLQKQYGRGRKSQDVH